MERRNWNIHLCLNILPSFWNFYIYIERIGYFRIASSDEKERKEKEEEKYYVASLETNGQSLSAAVLRFILGSWWVEGVASLAAAENFESFISAAIKQTRRRRRKVPRYVI